jgi:GNAT superfamily N-acetyltransferase
MPLDTLTPEGAVEEFERQFGDHPTLPHVMPMPALAAHSDYVELMSIGVHDAHQGHGYAGLALRILTDICEASRLTIELIARPLPLELLPGCTASKSCKQLVELYRGHGFELSEPNDHTVEMIRKPR